jgi:cysteine desulfurase
MAVNNEVGSINDLRAIKNILKNYPKAFFHCDATQAIGKINLDLDACDLLSLSAHKLNGFKGSGLLLKRKNIELMPLNSGGGQEFSFRSGTNNFPYEVSLAKTLRIAYENLDAHYLYVSSLNHHLRELLKDVEGVIINSPSNASPYILNFSINKKASVVAEALSLKEIYVSTKSACSSKKAPTSYVLLAMGKDLFSATNAIRVSLSYLNTMEELDTFVAELKKILISVK